MTAMENHLTIRSSGEWFEEIDFHDSGDELNIWVGDFNIIVSPLQAKQIAEFCMAFYSRHEQADEQ
jgi:hypothetical protein